MGATKDSSFFSGFKIYYLLFISSLILKIRMSSSGFLYGVMF